MLGLLEAEWDAAKGYAATIKKRLILDPLTVVRHCLVCIDKDDICWAELDDK